MLLINRKLEKLLDHFEGKADRSKRYYMIYKYGSILLAALITIVASLMVIYPTVIPQWILPITSALATVAVAFLVRRESRKYGRRKTELQMWRTEIEQLSRTFYSGGIENNTLELSVLRNGNLYIPVINNRRRSSKQSRINLKVDFSRLKLLPRPFIPTASEIPTTFS